MKKILIVWELGGGYGHISTFLELANTLKKRGFDVSFALKDLDYNGRLLVKRGFRCVKAPVWNHFRGVTSDLNNYTEMLTRFGYLDSKRLLPVVKAWRDLFNQLSPDLIIANHSPTALFASAGLDLKKAIYGTGFECPPRLRPFPKLDPRSQVTESSLLATDAQVLESINQISDELAMPARQQVSDILEADAEFLCTFAELDPYLDYRNAPEYWGLQVDTRLSKISKWKSMIGKDAVFAYLRPNYTRLTETLAALKQLDHKVVVHCPRLPADFKSDYETGKLSFVDEPLQIKDIVSKFRMIVSHAGHGTSLALLLEGCPHFMLPMYTEQLITARRVTDLGAGRYLEKNDDTQAISDELINALDDKSLRLSAREFSRRYPGFSQSEQTGNLSRRIIALMNQDET
ncbi:MAG: nucleotide disphospho-sugar-binding domain-containing protein [Pseudomonadota bacterium]